MSYSFTATENTTLMTVNFAAVLCAPEGGNTTLHEGEENPTFKIEVTVTDPSTGEVVNLPCGSFTASASESAAMLVQNDTYAHCTTSSAGSSAENYMYIPWTAMSYDLSECVGKTVTLSVINHDCLVRIKTGNYKGVVAGGHESYGYFRAETRKLQLVPDVCGNKNYATITAPPGFVSYTWSRSDGRPVELLDPNDPTVAKIPVAYLIKDVVYTCVVRDATGCSQVSLTTKADPITINPNFTYTNDCSGLVHFTNTSTIVGDELHPTQAYFWDFGDGTYSEEENPDHTYATSGEYQVSLMVKSKNGCDNTRLKTVNVRFFPTLSINGPSSVCKDAEIALTCVGASANSTYLWNDPAASTNQTLRTPAVESRDYGVIVTDEYGCTYTKSAFVTVNPLPELFISGESPICLGQQSATLGIAGASTYQWSTGETTTQITVSPTYTTKYYVVGTGANGCAATDSFTVVVNSLPDIRIAGESFYCDGDQVVLTAQNGVSYLWSDLSQETTLTKEPAVGTYSYSVRGWDAHGCYNDATKNVTVYAIPELTYSGNESACRGSALSLAVAGPYGTTYLWQDGVTTSDHFYTTAQRDSVYQVTGTLNGCFSTIDIPFAMYPDPELVITVDPQSKEICVGDTAYIRVTGAASYAWNTGSSANQLKVYPTITSTYTVNAHTLYGCPGSASVELTVHSLPTVTLTADKDAICSGDDVTLTAGGASTYLWSDFNSGAQRTFEPDETTLYTVTGTDANGCRNTATKSITVRERPTITYDGPNGACVGDPVSYTLDGADEYVWPDGSTGNRLSAIATVDTTYEVTGTRNNCSRTIYIPFHLYSNPAIAIATSTPAICPGETARLRASGAATYKWQHVGVVTTIGDVDVSPVTTTTYWVEGFTSLGCPGSASREIVVNPSPSPTITAVDAACTDSVITLRADGAGTGGSYAWTHDADTHQERSVVLTGTTTFEVTATTAAGCPGTATKTITAYENPTITYSGPAEACEGDPVTFVADGASSYRWSNNTNGNTLTFTAVDDVTYTVYGTRNGCTNSTTASLVVNKKPTLSISADRTAVCRGGAATITVTAPTGSTYRWLHDGSTTATITVTPVSTTTYTVEVTTQKGCKQTTQITITVNDNPTLSITSVDEACTDSLVTLTAAGADTYAWTTGAQTASITVPLTGTTTYTVYGTMTATGCQSSAVKTIVAKPNPSLSFDGATAGCVDHVIVLTAQGAGTYLWSDGTTSPTFSMQITDNTTVSVTGTTNGCTASLQIPITKYNRPTLAWIQQTGEICYGQTATLEVGGALNYTWAHDNSTSPVASLSPTTTTTYTVTGVDGNGCENTLSKEIVVNALPTISIAGVDAACTDSTITLTASGAGAGGTYAWEGGVSGAQRTAVLTSNTTYTVTGIDAKGCQNTATKTVTAKPNPVLGFTGRTTACEGDALTYEVNGATTYIWDDGSNAPTKSVTAAMTTSFTVSGTTNGCTSRLTIPLTVNPKPTLSMVRGDAAICYGGSTVIEVSGAASYQWAHDGSTSASITVSPNVATTYTVVGSTSDGCQNSIQHTVAVNDKPTIIITASDAACTDSTVTLIASGAGATGTYAWNGGATGDQRTVVLASTTTYTVTGTDANGCQNTATKTITAKPNPVLGYTGITTPCEGDAVTYTVSGATTYVWTGGSTSESSSFVAAADTTLYVRGTTNGCTGSLSIPVTVYSKPNIVIVSGAPEICNGGSTTIVADGAVNYLWSHDASTNPSITVNPTTTTTYTVTGTSAHGCQKTAQHTVTVNERPTITITAVDAACTDSTVTLTASGAGATGTYAWDGGASGASRTVVLAANTTYTVTGTDANGCQNTATKTITAKPNPVLGYTGITTPCEGDAVTYTVSGATTYVWDGGSTSESTSFVAASDTTLSVRGTTNGCTAALNIPVTVYSKPNVTIVSGDPAICMGGSTTIVADGAVNYQWSHDGSTNPSITVNPTTATTYTVTGSNAHGCQKTAQHTVAVNERPTIVITAVDAACTDSTVTLTASGAGATGTYAWDGGASGASRTVVLAANTTYTVTGTDANGCQNTATKTITAKPNPVLGYTGVTTPCEGDAVTYSVSGATTYLWTGGSTSESSSFIAQSDTVLSVRGTTNGCTAELSIPVTVHSKPDIRIVSGAGEICNGGSTTIVADGALSYVWTHDASTQSSITVSPTMTTTYTVTGTNVHGCQKSAQHTVTVNERPTITIAAVDAACVDSTVTLTASGAGNGGSYAWDGGAVGAVRSVVISNTSTYTVTGTDAKGCVGSVSKTITANTNPTLGFTGLTAACEDQTLTYTVTGAATYVWGDGSTGETLTTVAVHDTTYTVAGTSNGCTSRLEIPFTVYRKPTLSIVRGDAAICYGGTTTIEVQGADSYRWTHDGSTEPVITVAPTTSTPYTVIGSTSYGCERSISHTVGVNALPTIQVAASSEDVCAGTDVTFTASGAGATGTYAWVGGGNEASFTATLANAVPYTYTVTGTDANGCQNTASKTVTPKANPVLGYTGLSNACIGASLTYTATGADDYVWDDGTHGSMMTTTAATSTTFTVTGTTNGCSTVLQIPFVINPNPVLQFIRGDDEICYGGSTTIEAQGALTYEWNTGSNSAAVTVSPTTRTIYSVVGTSDRGCTSEASFTVDVKQDIPVVITGLDAQCTGGTVTLTASGAGTGGTYMWADGETANPRTVTVNSDVTYSVTGTSTNGCTKTVTKTITAKPNPNLGYTGPANACPGTSITYVGQGADSYVWQEGLADETEGTSFITTATANATYHLKGEINGCFAELEIDFKLFATPDVQVTSAKTSICPGEQLTLVAQNAATYNWPESNENTASIVVSPLSSHTYTVTGYSADGCPKTINYLVTVLSEPAIEILASADVVCADSTVQLTATGAGTGGRYEWWDNKTEAIRTEHLSAQTEYSVTGYDANGCHYTATKTVRTKPNPVLAIDGPANACPNADITFTASGADSYLWQEGQADQAAGAQLATTATASKTYTVRGEINGCYAWRSTTFNLYPTPTVTITGNANSCPNAENTLTASGAASYVWAHSGETAGTITVQPAAQTTYTVTGTSANGCTAQQTHTIAVYSLPPVAIQVNNGTVCADSAVVLTATGAGAGGTYTWWDNRTDTQRTEHPAAQTTYSVTGMDAHGCTASNTVTVRTKPNPVLAIDGPANACPNTDITFTASGADSYLWQEGQADQAAGAQLVTTATASKTYTVRGEIDGCYAWRSTTFNLYPSPTITITGNANSCPNAENTLTASGASTYVWAHSGETAGTITVQPAAQTTYTVTGTSANGCTAQQTHTIAVYSLPPVAIQVSANTICADSAVVLTATGAGAGGTYTWWDNRSDAQRTEYPATQTTYSVTGMDAHGCTATNTVTVSTKPNPVLAIDGPANACPNADITFTASGADSYLWQEGQADQAAGAQLATTATASKTYTVRGEIDGCYAWRSTTFNLYPTPTITITGNANSCPNAENTLTASGAASYVWAHSGETAGTITVQPAAQTTYTVTGTSANGCTAQQTHTIAVYSLPPVAIQVSANTICADSAVVLTATGVGAGGTYTWWDNRSDAQRTEYPAAQTTYSVTGMDAHGCTATNTVTVSTKPNPVLAIDGPANACPNADITFTASGADSYLWQEGQADQAAGAQLATTATASKTYTVRGEIDGCYAWRSTTFNLYPTPTITITGNANSCPNAENTLTASGASTYVWAHSGETAGTITVQPAAQTTYTVTGTSANGCTAQQTHTIDVYALPPVAIQVNNGTVCADSAVVLTATGAGAGGTYTWWDNRSDAQRTEYPSAQTTYSLTGRDANGCTATATRTVSTKPNPVLAIDGPANACPNADITFTASGADSYLWQEGQADEAAGARLATTATASKTYTVRGEIDGCYAWRSTTFNLYPTPTVTITGNANSCPNTENTLSASGASTYVWTSTNETTPSIVVKPMTTTTYTVTGTSVNGCTAQQSHTVTVYNLPPITLTADYTTVCADSTVTLTASGAGVGGHYLWWDNRSDESRVETVSTETTYTLTGYDANNCSATVSRTISTKPNPVLAVEGPANACPGAEITFSASGADSYLWQEGQADQTAGAQLVTSATASKTYTVRGEIDGCYAWRSTTFNLYPTPTVTITGNANSCPDTENTLSASGAATYLWTLSNETSQAIVVKPATTTTYTVIGTSANGCTAQQTHTVSVYNLPPIALDVDFATVCADSAVTLTASGAGVGGHYLWWDNRSDESRVETVSAQTTYTLTGYDANNCSATVSRTVSTKPNPVLAYTGPSNACPGDAISFVVSGATTYLWQGGETGATLSTTARNDTVYHVRGGSNGCYADLDIHFNLYPTPNVQINITGSEEICPETTTFLRATGADTYYWPHSGETASSISVTPDVSTTYTVVGYSAQRCEAVATQNIVVLPRPAVDIVVTPLAVCADSAVTLTATGAGTGGTYEWWDHSTDLERVEYPRADTTYTLTGFNAAGCSYTISKLVRTKANPVLAYTGPSNACEGDDITFVLSGADSYVWADGSAGSTLATSAVQDTTYRVRGEVNGCFADLAIDFRLFPTPTIQINGNHELCKGSNITLRATGASTYRWLHSSETTSDVVVAPLEDRSYTVVGTSSNGCTAEQTVAVTVHNLPVIDIALSETSVCADSVVTLTASGAGAGGTYEWDNNSQNPVRVEHPSASTTYTVTGIDAHACRATVSRTVNTKENPVITIVGATELCANETQFLLSAQGGTSYQWSDNSTNSMITIPVTASTSVSVRGWKDGCSAEASANLTVKPVPDVWISGVNTICENDTVTLTADGAATYLWTDGATTAAHDVAPSVTRTFTVRGTAVNGCSMTADHTITVNPAPALTLTAPDRVCYEGELVLTAAGAESYEWEDGENTPERIEYPTQTKTYTVTGMDAIGCKAIRKQLVTVVSRPTLTVTGRTNVCEEDENFEVYVNGASSYEWHDGSTGASFITQAMGNIEASVTGWLNGCSTRVDTLLTIKSKPRLNLNGPDNICMYDRATLSVNGADSYSWRHDGSTASVLEVYPYVTSTYVVTGTSAAGCTTTDSLKIQVNSLPDVTITAVSEICSGNTVSLTAAGAVGYEWNTTEFGPEISVTPMATTTYTVTGTDANGCFKTVSHKLNVKTTPTLTVKGDLDVCQEDGVFYAVVSGADSYVWSDGTTGNIFTADADHDMDIWVTGTKNGCSATVDTTLVTRDKPYLWITGPTYVCQGAPAELTVHGADYYLWGHNNSNIETVVVSPTAANHAYRVTGTNDNGCVTTLDYSVDVKLLPVIQVAYEETVCRGNTVHMTASGADLYQWDNGDYGEYREDIPNANTTYSVTGTDNYSCRSTKSFAVVVNTLPSLTYTGNTTLCKGEDFNIYVQGAFSYVWQDGSTDNKYTYSNANVDKMLTVVGTTNGCQSDPLYIQLNVLDKPNVYIDAPATVCNGTTTVLTAHGAVDYIWSDATTGSVKTVNPNVKSTYRVEGYSDNGCYNSASVTVDVWALPDVKLTGENSICEDEEITLTATGAEVYVWDDNVGGGRRTFALTGDRTFTVTGTDGNGCVNTATKSVTVHPYPDLSYDGNTTLCQGKTVQLTVTGANNWVWKTDPSSTDVITTSNFISETADQGKTYFVYGTTDGCTSLLQIPVSVYPKPIVFLEASRSEVCAGDDVTLWASGAVNYDWNTHASSDEIQVNPLTTTVFTVTGSNAIGCISDPVSKEIAVHELPQVTISGKSDVCLGDYAPLHAEGTGTLYRWSSESGSVSSVGADVAVPVSGEESFFCTAQSSFGCEATAEFRIYPVVIENLGFVGQTKGCIGDTLTLVGQGATSYLWPDGTTDPTYKMIVKEMSNVIMYGSIENCTQHILIPITPVVTPNILISGDTLVCKNIPFTITAEGAESYVWSTGETTATIGGKINTTTNYYVTGSNGACTTTKKVTMGVYPSPEVRMKITDYSVCPYREDSVMFNATGADTYVWYSLPSYESVDDHVGNRLRAEVPNDTWVYVVGTNNDSHCSTKDSVHVIDLPQTEFKYEVQPNWIEEGSSRVRFVGLSPGSGTTWLWEPGDGSDEQKGSVVAYEYDVTNVPEEFNAKVYAEDKFRCRFEAEIPIHVWKPFWAPDAFTPNGDGTNDKFHFYGGQYIEEFTFVIYNRLGEIVFSGDSLNTEWDGTFNGKPCPWGVYGWVANYRSDQFGMAKSGTVRGAVSIVK